jgi:site-specific DNA recombinase
MTTTMKAVGYIRVSTNEQAMSGVSLDAQREAITAYCKMRGLELVQVLEDAGISAGKALHSRPAGSEIAPLVKSGVQHVIAFKMDRLFRSTTDAIEQVAMWEKQNVSMHLVSMGGTAIDSSTATGKFMLTVLAGASEMERNLIRERTRNALQHKKSKGERISGRAPYGYRFEEGMVVEDPPEKRTLKKIQKLRKKGLSYQKIADRLAKTKIFTRTGRPFSAVGVRHLALNCA